MKTIAINGVEVTCAVLLASALTTGYSAKRKGTYQHDGEKIGGCSQGAPLQGQ